MLPKKTLDEVGRDFFCQYFSLIVAAKMFHYRTRTYSAHKTIDDFFEKFIQLSDTFLECWQGAYNRRITFNSSSVIMEIPVITDKNWRKILDKHVYYLENVLPYYEMSGDMLNIRDEMVTLIKQTKYLLSFD